MQILIFKKAIVILVLCLVVPAFLFAQIPATLKIGEAEGTKLGNIISTVIGIVLPPLQPLIKLIFPDPASKDTDTVKISKKDLQSRLDQVRSDMEKDIKATLDPVNRIAKEVGVLGNVLKPCIEVQDYLREINVLIARSPIPDDNWKRVTDLWSLMKAKINNICSDKNCDLSSIRNTYVKDDLTRIIDIGKGTKLDRLEIDYIKLPLIGINSADKATLLRVEISNVLELYQTVQQILTLSLQDLQADFSGAYDALALKNTSTETMGTKSLGIELPTWLWPDPMQFKIAARLDEVLKKLPDRKK